MALGPMVVFWEPDREARAGIWMPCLRRFAQDLGLRPLGTKEYLQYYIGGDSLVCVLVTIGLLL
jgi:hypothetical protein